ncbi:helix-turn-helix domain-containing protein [Burkholderia gladioli]|uniref:helix-turn-helix domain-containing protein n=1 Tax=Burkholderia gladioli TaxID=28095 RepID=UPI001640D7A6|nr:helix-turn-helix domain-containing protein [Burkholderia gladioli]
MASTESILKLIVDRPGLTAAELADELDTTATDVQSRLAKYITSEHVKREKKKLENRDVWIYFPSQSLVNEGGGLNPDAMKRAPRTPAAAAAPGVFTFGFFSDGALSIAKGSKEIRLTHDEAERLIKFLDAINIDRITAGA